MLVILVDEHVCLLKIAVRTYIIMQPPKTSFVAFMSRCVIAFIGHKLNIFSEVNQVRIQPFSKNSK